MTTVAPGSTAPKWAIEVIRARYLVAALGEGASPPWWSSQATSPVGQRFLARLYPRTFLLASLEAATRAARREHDERIGRIGVYHLFRLPSADEATVYDALREPVSGDLLISLAAIAEIEPRLAALGNLAGDVLVVDAPGPVSRGTATDLRVGRALPKICATYIAAFRTNRRAYPYLEESGT